MSYSEGNRENVCKLKAYVEEMASADLIFGLVNIQKIQDDVVKTQPDQRGTEESNQGLVEVFENNCRSFFMSPNE